MDAYICGDIFACVLIMENYHLTAPSFPLKKKKKDNGRLKIKLLYNL